MTKQPAHKLLTKLRQIRARSRTRDLANSNGNPRPTSQAPPKVSCAGSDLTVHELVHVSINSTCIHFSRHGTVTGASHPRGRLTGWRITPERNGCGSPRGTQTTGPGGLDQSSASVGSCVPGRNFGRWWRGVHRRHHCWPRVCFPPVLRTLCGRRSCLPSLAVRG